MPIKKINLNKIDELFYLYEPLVLSIARRLQNTLYFLPKHITEEFENEARYSLIKTLNEYNRKYFNSDRRPVSLKTEIVWKTTTRLSDWWSKTYCGCRKWITQRKHNILPISKEEIELMNKCEMNNIDTALMPHEHLINKEENKISSKLIQTYKNKLRIKRFMFDALLLNYQEYDLKYPGMMTLKQHDNNKQKVRRQMLAILKEELDKLENNNKQGDNMPKRKEVKEVVLCNSCCGDGLDLVNLFKARHPEYKVIVKKYNVFKSRDMGLDKKYGFNITELGGNGRAILIVDGKIYFRK